MREINEPIKILLADDDDDDKMLVKEALRECQLANELYCVADGEEVMDFLYHRGPYTDPASSPRPGLILLDLNMPRKDGREALREIKTNPSLRCIPVIVLSTSQSEEEVYNAYDLGANSYIAKPVTFTGLVDIMDTIRIYWTQIVQLPRDS